MIKARTMRYIEMIPKLSEVTVNLQNNNNKTDQKLFLIICFCTEIYIHISMMSFGTVNTAYVWFHKTSSLYYNHTVKWNMKHQFILFFFLPRLTGPSCGNA